MMLETVKVKRDGGKGWKLINKDSFDPKVHVLFDAPVPGEVDDSVGEEPAEVNAPVRRRRTAK